MKKRNLSDIDITHYVHYRFKDYRRPFLEKLLQAKHHYSFVKDVSNSLCVKIKLNGG